MENKGPFFVIFQENYTETKESLFRYFQWKFVATKGAMVEFYMFSQSKAEIYVQWFSRKTTKCLLTFREVFMQNNEKWSFIFREFSQKL